MKFIDFKIFSNKYQSKILYRTLYYVYKKSSCTLLCEKVSRFMHSCAQLCVYSIGISTSFPSPLVARRTICLFCILCVYKLKYTLPIYYIRVKVRVYKRPIVLQICFSIIIIFVKIYTRVVVCRRRQHNVKQNKKTDRNRISRLASSVCVHTQ